MKIAGVLLVVLGMLGLIYGGIGYKKEKTVLDLGPIKATATEQKNIPISPVVGGIAVIGGVLLLVIPKRRGV